MPRRPSSARLRRRDLRAAPARLLRPGAPPFRLMTADARARRMEKLGVEVLYELPFDAELAGLEPEAFAREVLAEGLGVRHVVVGADFRFGKGRAGDAATLRRSAPRPASASPSRRWSRTARATSPRPRSATALAEGRPGRGRAHPRPLAPDRGRGASTARSAGATLGFPTANLCARRAAPAAVRGLCRHWSTC